MIKRTKGDLLALADAGQFDVIAHGCNCFNLMGGGIARQIAQRYPMAAQVDKGTKRGDSLKLGTMTLALVPQPGFFVANLYTQYQVSAQGEDVFEYEHFVTALKQLRMHFYGKRIGLPMIGCGLAGGDEKLIMATVEHYLGDQDVTVVEYAN